IVAMMLAGYYAAYSFTPIELQYHLETSLNRLLLQLWPTVLFMICLGVGRFTVNTSRWQLRPIAVIMAIAGLIVWTDVEPRAEVAPAPTVADVLPDPAVSPITVGYFQIWARRGAQPDILATLSAPDRSAQATISQPRLAKVLRSDVERTDGSDM